MYTCDEPMRFASCFVVFAPMILLSTHRAADGDCVSRPPPRQTMQTSESHHHRTHVHVVFVFDCFDFTSPRTVPGLYVFFPCSVCSCVAVGCGTVQFLSARCHRRSNTPGETTDDTEKKQRETSNTHKGRAQARCKA